MIFRCYKFFKIATCVIILQITQVALLFTCHSAFLFRCRVYKIFHPYLYLFHCNEDISKFLDFQVFLEVSRMDFPYLLFIIVMPTLFSFRLPCLYLKTSTTAASSMIASVPCASVFVTIHCFFAFAALPPFRHCNNGMRMVG